jgi:hypothetical protein
MQGSSFTSDNHGLGPGVMYESDFRPRISESTIPYGPWNRDEQHRDLHRSIPLALTAAPESDSAGQPESSAWNLNGRFARNGGIMIMKFGKIIGKHITKVEKC